MANSEHLALLQQGVDVWNRWRNEHQSIVPDLSGENLSKANLWHANLWGANLSGANLSGANLMEANIPDADLSKANLSGAKLWRANLSGTNLCGVDFHRTDLSGTNLSGANLSKANLWHAHLSGANLYGTNFSGTNLRSANLSEVNLGSADLSNTLLSGANLSGADLSKANLSGENLSGTNLSGANLSGTHLCGANLSGANFRSADLSGTDLSRADLSEANLRSADLSRTYLSGAIISRADLSKVNLRGANLGKTDLNGANLSGANLIETNLVEVNLSNAYLWGADLSGANLSEMDLSEANLGGVNFSGANLSWANLRRANLSGANLSKANLHGAYLGKASLGMAYLWGAKLRGANFDGANLSGANLDGTNLDSHGLLMKEWNTTLGIEPTGLTDTTVTDTVQFTAYYPRDAKVNTRYSFLLYAHTEEAFEKVANDVEKFRDELGNKMPPPKTAKQTTQIKLDTPITVVPECGQIEFDPPSLTKKWSGEWTRFGFDFRPTLAISGDTLFVRVSIQVATIEVAHINCAVEVIEEKAGSDQHIDEAENPLAEAKLNSSTSDLYQTIFISYSRKDKAVAKVYKLVQEAVGNVAFMDTYSIRAGEDWRSALALAIDKADIFQLFWSENSAGSPNVRDEWEYALQNKCPENRCIGFIRPVCWNDPIKPSPPEELGHLNFKYVPLDELFIS